MDIDDVVALSRQALLTIRHDKKGDYDSITKISDSELAGRDSESVFSVFRIQLAREGASRTLGRLERMKGALRKEDYVRIGSAISSAIGDYHRELGYLDFLEVGKHGWVERERIRCCIATSRFDEAVSHVFNLIALDKKKINSEFCLNALWQLSRWDELEYLLQHIESANLKRYVDFNKELRRKGVAQSAQIFTLYTGLSRNQLSFQQEWAKAAGLKLTPAMGVTVDRFPTNALKLLGGEEFAPGVIGASLGHLKAIEAFVASGEPYCFITESDAFLSKLMEFGAFDEIFRAGRYDFILCADRHADMATDAIRNQVVDYRYSGHASGFDGYALSRGIAMAILDNVGAPYREHIDVRIIDWLANTAKAKIGVVTEPIFAQSMLSVFSVRAALELNY